MCGIWGLLSYHKNTIDLSLLFNKFNEIQTRGPDKTNFVVNSNYIVGFHRLSIMDLSIAGDQPFSTSYTYVLNGDEILRTVYVCVNGEIYNYVELEQLIEYKYKSASDCEVLLPSFLKYIDYDNMYEGINKLLELLDGEFAISIYDIHQNITTGVMNYNLWLARDRFGIRPLFYTELNDDTICFGSELKSINNINNNKCYQVAPRNWYYWGNGNIKHMTGVYYEIIFNINYRTDNLIYEECRRLLTKSVVDRLHADRDIGCLLSGGLDSSLVAAIAANELKKYGKVLKTFSIGMPDSPDVHHAYIVANHIGSEHTNFMIPSNEWLDALSHVIKISETFDITTIRATTAQYLISKKISETTNIKVLLVGDGSDELTGGYLYFHKAPSHDEFNNETKRLLESIHFFDVLRADRGIASNGLEARVPFLAHAFVDFYFTIHPSLKMPRPHILMDGSTSIYEKYLLRKSFDGTNLLPECVLWRRKEAFSDGVSSTNNSWYSIIKDNIHVPDEEFTRLQTKYTFNDIVPISKEALFYMMEFEKHYPNQFHVIPYYWMPKWIHNATDPSARTLDLYK